MITQTHNATPDVARRHRRPRARRAGRILSGCLVALALWAGPAQAVDLTVTTSTLPDHSTVNLFNGSFATDATFSATVVNLDFGAGLPAGSSFQLRVWYDADGNGAYDPSETDYGQTVSLPAGLGPRGSAAPPDEITIPLAFPTSGLQPADFRNDLVYAEVVVGSIEDDTGAVVPEVDETNNLIDSGQACRRPAAIDGLEVQCQWQGASGSLTGIISTPVVAPLPGEDYSTIFVIDYAGSIPTFSQAGNITAINGEDCSQIWVRSTGARPGIASSLAIGNLDADPGLELVTSREILNAEDGSLVATIQGREGPIYDPVAVSLTDLDADGVPEIVMGRQAFNADGTLRWTGTSGRGRLSYGTLSVPADLNDDGFIEVVGGPSVYAEDGTLLWDNTAVGDGGSTIADLDLDGTPEVILSSSAVGGQSALLHVLQPGPGMAQRASVATNTGTGVTVNLGANTGPPSIANVYDDPAFPSLFGRPEVIVAGAQAIKVFAFTDDPSGSFPNTLEDKYCYPTQDDSANTSVSVFDFNGDGIGEIVYSDEISTKVLGVPDNPACVSPPATDNAFCPLTADRLCVIEDRIGVIPNGTAVGNPIIVDTDNDGSAEIVAISETTFRTGVCTGLGPNCLGGGGLYILRDPTDDGTEDWVNTRNLWNQHAYSINHIDNDGTVPTTYTQSWLDHNTFRSNLPDIGDGRPLAADLTASVLRATVTGPTQLTVTGRIGNAGGRTVLAGVDVSFYAGDPLAGGTLIGTVQTTTDLAPGAFQDVGPVVWNSPDVPTVTSVWMAVDDDGTQDGTDRLNGVVQECFETDPVVADGVPTGGTPNSTIPNNVAGQALAEIAVSKLYSSPGDPDAVVAGETLQFTLQATNTGTLPLDPAVISDVVPPGLTYTGGVGTGWIDCSPGPLSPGNTLTCRYAPGLNVSGSADGSDVSSDLVLSFTVDSDYVSAGTNPDPIDNTAVVTGATGLRRPDSTPYDVTAQDNDTAPVTARSNLAVTKDDGSTTYTPGGTATYVVTVTNAGPSDAGDVDVTDSLPTGVTLTGPVTCTVTGTATCGSASAGTAGDTGFTLNNSTIAAGAGNALVLSVPVAFAASLTTDPLVNTATATDPADTGGPKNGSDTNNRESLVGLVVDKDDGSPTYTPGGTATYVVTVTNQGPTNAGDVDVTDALPTGVTLTGPVTCTVTGTATCGSASTGTAGDTAFTLNNSTIAAGAGNALVLSVPVAFAANLTTDPLVNTAFATDPDDPDGANGSDGNNRDAVTDLSVTKDDGSLTYLPGGVAIYEMVVSNAGPSDALDVTVTDPLPAGTTLTGPVTCTAAGTATCGSASTGGLGDVTFTLTGSTIAAGAGNTLTLSVPVAFAPSLVAASLVNTVTVTDPGDPDGAQASDINLRASVIDLLASKDDGVDTYTPGGTSTYTIEVTNAGPSDAQSVSVIDDLPAGLTLDSAVLCAASGGAVCGTLSEGAPGDTRFQIDGNQIPAGGVVSGGVLTLTVPVRYAADLTTDPLVNVVRALDPNDPTTAVEAEDSNRRESPVGPPGGAMGIPTLGPWALVLLSGLMLWMGAYRQRAAR
ncbi:conserved repeat domain protein [gamma proteobacterium NOR5-3]|nr:conserved repeat domain protein [gamma proteobacterium NOR5-3]